MRSVSAASFCLLPIVSLLSRTAVAGSTADWRSRSIYQIMTDRFARTDGSTTAPCDTNAGMYCGGTWRGIIEQLDYVQGMGFSAIYISPVTENLDNVTKYGQAYHGYWPQDIYSLNGHFGSRDDLVALSQALHSRGMYLMLDAVINDMGYDTNGLDPETDIDYSVFHPFNDEKYFHSFCNITNYSNYTDAQDCWLGDDYVALPDLKTEDPYVVSTMGSWVQELITNYSVDGLRVDAAKHVNNAFLQSFADSAGIFAVGEVYEGNASVFCPYQELIPSMTNYPTYFAIVEAFTDGNISALAQQMQVTKQSCADTTALASFSENHDVPRMASYTKDISLLKSVLAFTIMADGVPMIYAGQEQAFSGNATPFNREALWTSGYNTNSELYQFTRLLNQMRSHAIAVNPDYLDYQAYPIYTDGSTIVLRKGEEGREVVSVLSNSGTEQGDYTLMLPTAYTSGAVVMDIVSCINYTVSDQGELTLPMGQGVPHILFPAAKMNGSQICGMGNWSAPIKGLISSAPRQSNVYSSSVAIIVAVFSAFCFF